MLRTLGQNWHIALYAIVLMTAFNFFSHGTQDLYPTFLTSTFHYDARTTGTIAIVYNIGAILGGWTFGIWSQRIGRRRAMMIGALLAIPVTYVWVFSTTAVLLAAGAFLMQFCVQGAWGVVPAYLMEGVPDRQFHRLFECAAADLAGCAARWRLPCGAGLGGAGRRGGDRAADLLRRRAGTRSRGHSGLTHWSGDRS